MDEATKQRIAENEALFREVNERVQETERERLEAASPDTRWEFLCECGNEGCREPLRLTVADYEKLRSSPVRFAVLPGHDEPELARVVDRGDGFLIVEKKRGESEVALATDPRS